MLKKFGFENSYCFRGWVWLDMSAELSDTKVCEDGYPMPKQDEVHDAVRMRIEGRKHGVLPVAAIYGKNASGKTRLLTTLRDVVDDVLDKSFSSELAIPTASPFKKIVERRQFGFLSPEKRNNKLRYSICIVVKNKEYTLEYTLTPEGIEEEELTRRSLKPNARKMIVYKRYGYHFCEKMMKNSNIAGNIDLMMASKEKRLWFSRIAPALPGLKDVYAWFNALRRWNYETGANKTAWFEAVAEAVDKIGSFRTSLLGFLQCLDSSIEDISGTKRSEKYTLELFHRTFDGGKESHSIGEESEGTLKLIEQFPYVFNSLAIGDTPYICDELDKALHPIAFWQLVRMFNDPKVNRTNAQLIFTAHDTIALDSNIMRRDEVHIIDKNDHATSKITRLSEMEHVQRYSNMEYEFRTGYYGSFPDKFNKSFESLVGEGE